MAYFVVTYDLRKKNWPDYEVLIDELESMNSVKYQESCWFVDNTQTTKQIKDKMSAYIHENDLLMVVKFTERPTWTKALTGTSAWIDARFS